MTLEFMTGATVFALINLIILLTGLYFAYRFGYKIVNYYLTDPEERKVNFKFDIFVAIILCAFLMVFGSVSQPKLSINPPENRELIEYQNNREEIVIETPAPRTETLQGFEPLKK